MDKINKIIVVLTTLVVLSPVLFSFRNVGENWSADSGELEYEGYIYRLYKVNNRQIAGSEVNIIFKKTAKGFIDGTTIMTWCQMLTSDSVSITALLDTSIMRIPVRFPVDSIRVSTVSGSASVMVPTGLSEYEISNSTKRLAVMLEMAFEISPFRKVDDDTSYVIKCIYIDGKFDSVSYPKDLIVTELVHINPYDAPDCFPVLYDDFWNKRYDSSYVKRNYGTIEDTKAPYDRIKFKGFLIRPLYFRYHNGPVSERMFERTGDSIYITPKKVYESDVIYSYNFEQQKFSIINDMPSMIRMANDADTTILVPYEEKWFNIIHDAYIYDAKVRLNNDYVGDALWPTIYYTPIIYNPKAKDDLFRCFYLEGYMTEINSHGYEIYVSENGDVGNKKLMRIDSLTYCNPFYIPEGYLLWSPLENDTITSYNFRMYQRANIDSVLNELK